MIYSIIFAAQSVIDGGPLPGSKVSNTDSNNLQQLLYVFFGILGAIAVLMIVIAGFRYIISAGDPQKAAQARNSITYAVVGLAVAITAEAIVAFVVGKL